MVSEITKPPNKVGKIGKGWKPSNINVFREIIIFEKFKKGVDFYKNKTYNSFEHMNKCSNVQVNVLI